MINGIKEIFGMAITDFVEENPRFAKLRDRGTNIMVTEYTKPPVVVTRRSFLRDCWDAWSPRRRSQRAQKLMPDPTPVANLWWRVYRWIRYSKEERSKPWTVEISYSPDGAMLRGAESDDLIAEVDREVREYDRWDTGNELLSILTNGSEHWTPKEKAAFTADYEKEKAKPMELPWPPDTEQTAALRRYYLEREQAMARVDELNRNALKEEPRSYRYGYETGAFGALQDYPFSIRCETCGFVSYNSNDIREKYCGHCRMYHDDGGYPGRQREIMETLAAKGFTIDDRNDPMTDPSEDGSFSAMADISKRWPFRMAVLRDESGYCS